MDDPTRTMHGDSPEPGGGPPAARGAGLGVWGPFELREQVGQGGFGEVYRAWDPKLQREVAVKLLLASRTSGAGAYESVLREARLTAKVRHPNVVSVHGVELHEGRVGFWTDFVRGKTLAALLAGQGSFGAREAALIGIELCGALGAVHAAGLLHRDIKPGNVMREEGGRILLMDFGLTHEAAGGGFGGTLPYMAPELLTGQS
ncbi:MAG: serine/threonine-protein kinase, partial [Candidatus Solibacter sp.]|nr:serine/threonine-protein kinase [Candidatus Solibacter sp.]